MNLQPVNPPRDNYVLCIVCGRMGRTTDMLADLDGVPFKSFVHRNGTHKDEDTTMWCENRYREHPEQFNNPPTSVIRYVPTYVNKDGMRTLMRATQGRETFATKEEAQDWLIEVLGNNSPEKIKQIYGDKPYPFEVRPVECWPGHHDPKTIWFD